MASREVAVGAVVVAGAAATAYYCAGKGGGTPNGGADAAGAASLNPLSGGAAAGQGVFDSVEAMETWVAEGSWTCLLIVGNNAAGYTEPAFAGLTASVRTLLESADVKSTIGAALAAKKLLLVFGGDSISPKQRNIASVAQWAQVEMGLPVSAQAILAAA